MIKYIYKNSKTYHVSDNWIAKSSHFSPFVMIRVDLLRTDLVLDDGFAWLLFNVIIFEQNILLRILKRCLRNSLAIILYTKMFIVQFVFINIIQITFTRLTLAFFRKVNAWKPPNEDISNKQTTIGNVSKIKTALLTVSMTDTFLALDETAMTKVAETLFTTDAWLWGGSLIVLFSSKQWFWTFSLKQTESKCVQDLLF